MTLSQRHDTRRTSCNTNSHSSASVMLDKVWRKFCAINAPDLAQQFGADFTIVAVCDLLKGSVCDPNGLDPATLLDAVTATGKIETMTAPHHGWDALRTIAESGADIVVELSYTDLKTGEPALTHLRAALNAGKHVVTTNKGPIALHYAELKKIAEAKGVEIGAEGTVMSGTPSMRLGLELLAAAGITRLQGIINGTTNYILTQMESGMTYADALKEAQAKGYAEADPTGDVEGYDAAGKAVILANLLMGAELTMNDVDRTGITGLTPQDITISGGERRTLETHRQSGKGEWSSHCQCAPHTPPYYTSPRLSGRRDQCTHLHH